MPRTGRPRKIPPPAPFDPPEQHWSLARVASWLDMTAAALVVHIEAGSLFARKIGKLWRVPDSAYRKFLRESEVTKTGRKTA